MADILLGQSYFLRFDPKLWAAMQPYPPLGTLYAAAALRARGHGVALFDAMLAEDERDWSAALDAEQPSLAVLFEDNFNYLSKMCLLRMREAALTMIGAAKERGCTVIVCGSDASDRSELYLDGGADFVIVGEGEQTLVELVERLENSGGPAAVALEDVDGLVYLSRSESSSAVASDVIRTRRRRVLTDLDLLPPPAWDLVDLECYRRAWRTRGRRFSLNLVSTRGCPFHCNWCAKPIWGQGYKSHAPAAVAQQIAELRALGAEHLWFADDILGLRRGWMAALADELAERDVWLPFRCQTRVDLLLREGEIEAFRRAGAETVWVGAESGSQRILDAMDKGTRVEQIREATRRLHQAGIRVGFFLQFGYPGETREDVEATRHLVDECRPDEIGMSVSYPLPGTKFYGLVREQLGHKRNWVDSEDLDMMFSGPFESAFYRQLYRVLHREFRARRRATELGRRLRAPHTLRARHLKEAVILGGQLLTLPFERYRLERYARPSARAIAPLRSGLSAEQAAMPTPQEETVPQEEHVTHREAAR